MYRRGGSQDVNQAKKEMFLTDIGHQCTHHLDTISIYIYRIATFNVTTYSCMYAFLLMTAASAPPGTLVVGSVCSTSEFLWFRWGIPRAG